MPNGPPHRRWEVHIRLGADEWQTLIRDLEQLAQHIAEHGPVCDSVMGGPDANHTVQVTERAEMTHERYFAELEAHLEQQRKIEDTLKAHRLKYPDHEPRVIDGKVWCGEQHEGQPPVRDRAPDGAPA